MWSPQERNITLTNDSWSSPGAPRLRRRDQWLAGKTTTTVLAGAIGRASGRRTWVGGNIGNPLIELGEIAAEDLIILELSSSSLSYDRSPAIAAI